jgi:hypothetical protein
MIDPQKAVFLYGDGRIVVCENGDCWKHDKGLTFSHGACFTGWKNLSDDQIYRAMDWLALEIVEFSGAPIRLARDAMLDNVAGYLEYSNQSGLLAVRGK